MFFGLDKDIKEDLEKEAAERIVPISIEQMYAAESAAVNSGIELSDLMLAAGQAVANHVHEHYADKPIIILCGAGNNGGDGYVAAYFLHELGHDVTVFGLVPVRKLSGPAKLAAKMWLEVGAIKAFKHFTEDSIADHVVIDAIFGIGFSRKIEEPVLSVLQSVQSSKADVVAIDVPSGLNADSGEADPVTLKAAHTVTFFRSKHGMYKKQGQSLCGEIAVYDIGIDNKFLSVENE